MIVTKGRVVLYRTEMGLRTALVTGVHKKGASLVIFGDSAESDIAALANSVTYVHSIKYGAVLGQWQWPREDDNVFDEAVAQEPDVSFAASKPPFEGEKTCIEDEPAPSAGDEGTGKPDDPDTGSSA